MIPLGENHRGYFITVNYVRAGIEDDSATERHTQAFRKRSGGIAHRSVIRNQEQCATVTNPMVHGVALDICECRHRMIVVVRQLAKRVRDHQDVECFQDVCREQFGVREDVVSVALRERGKWLKEPVLLVEIVVRLVDRDARVMIGVGRMRDRRIEVGISHLLGEVEGPCHGDEKSSEFHRARCIHARVSNSAEPPAFVLIIKPLDTPLRAWQWTKRTRDRQPPLWVPTTDCRQRRAIPCIGAQISCCASTGSTRERHCASLYAETMGRPGLPPGIYFRLPLIGYFEGIDSERGIAWRAADSLALRDLLRLNLSEAPPDHSTISRTRRLIDVETHRRVFTWVLQYLSAVGLVKGKTIGVDATTLEANAAMRSIVQRDTGEGYEEFLTRLVKASGIWTLSRCRFGAPQAATEEEGVE